MHVLVGGDPAGGKTLARDIIARRLGPEIELVGANATRSGLVCDLATGEPGVLTYSNGKIVLVDEFDKIPDQDVECCYELLSNGKCSIHSARVHETIESHFIMIAFANPVETVFVREPIKEIGLPPILLSRFALIVKAEELEAGRRKALLKRKLLGEAAAPELSRWHLPWLREARRYYPGFAVSGEEIEAYVDRVDKLIEEHLKTPLRRDLRMGDYAKRLPNPLSPVIPCTQGLPAVTCFGQQLTSAFKSPFGRTCSAPLPYQTAHLTVMIIVAPYYQLPSLPL